MLTCIPALRISSRCYRSHLGSSIEKVFVTLSINCLKVKIQLSSCFDLCHSASYKALDSTGASSATFLSEAAASTQVSSCIDEFSLFPEIHLLQYKLDECV